MLVFNILSCLLGGLGAVGVDYRVVCVCAALARACN
jgi:hypothetical protein